MVDLSAVPAKEKEPQGAAPPNPTAAATATSWFRNDQPLWLPPGSISSILVILVAVTICTTYILYKWAPPELVPVLVLAVQGYQQSSMERARIAADAAKQVEVKKDGGS